MAIKSDRVCLVSAPGVLYVCGGSSERIQPHLRFNRRQDVLLESGHALTAPGRTGCRAKPLSWVELAAVLGVHWVIC